MLVYQRVQSYHSKGLYLEDHPDRDWRFKHLFVHPYYVYIYICMYIYIYVYIYYIYYCVFPDIRLQPCMLGSLWTCCCIFERLRTTQGVTVCAKGCGSPVVDGGPGLPINREV